MALTLKQKVQIDQTALYLWITDKTGEYDAVDNDTGWGNLPDNPNLYQSCLLCYVEYQATAGAEEASPVSAQFIYDPSALNSDEKIFQFNYLNDGHYKSWLIRLMVTTDGVTSVDGITISEGDYFYMSGVIYQKLSGQNVEVTDYQPLTEDANLTKTMCNSFWSGKASKEHADKYQEYKEKLVGPCNENTIFQEMVMLREDIGGAFYAFKSGLTVGAQKVAETNIDTYNL
jgi:hypothetical protein